MPALENNQPAKTAVGISRHVRQRLLKRSPVPWEQLVQTRGGVVGNATEHSGEPGFGIDVVELRGSCRAPDYAEAMVALLDCR